MKLNQMRCTSKASPELRKKATTLSRSSPAAASLSHRITVAASANREACGAPSAPHPREGRASPSHRHTILRRADVVGPQGPPERASEEGCLAEGDNCLHLRFPCQGGGRRWEVGRMEAACEAGSEREWRWKNGWFGVALLCSATASYPLSLLFF